MSALYETRLAHLELLHRGKVRDLYRIDAEHLLIVASDRLSAFDVVLPQPIPGKGEVLTRVSRFWFGRLGDLLPNQLTAISVDEVVTDPAERAQLGDRALVVRRLKPLPVEAIVRGYLIGSGWKDYQRTGPSAASPCRRACARRTGCPRPSSPPPPRPPSAPTTRTSTSTRPSPSWGPIWPHQVRDAALAIYTECAAYALERGLIIADTKFEFGLDEAGS